MNPQTRVHPHTGSETPVHAFIPGPVIPELCAYRIRSNRPWPAEKERSCGLHPDDPMHRVES